MDSQRASDVNEWNKIRFKKPKVVKNLNQLYDLILYANLLLEVLQIVYLELHQSDLRCLKH